MKSVMKMAESKYAFIYQQQQRDRLIPIKSVRATFQRNRPSPILNKQAKLNICDI